MPLADVSKEDYFLPDFCERWNLLLVILIAEILAILLAAAQPGSFDDRLGYLAMDSLFIQWVALTDVALLCNSKRLWLKLSTPVAAALIFILLQAVTLVFTMLAFALSELTALSLTLPDSWLLNTLATNMLISVCVTAVVLRYFYVSHQWKLNVQAEARSRIAELQARIRPHFLFNSMNTIASLTRADPRKAEQAVEDLAEVFRASLANREQLTLAEELELARSYLRIEELRLGDRLKLEWDIQVDPHAVIMPALTLQPLLENAVYHGIEGLPGGGCIQVSALEHSKGVEINIANPLVNESFKRQKQGNHMALENIRQRLRLMFGHEDVLQVSHNHGQFLVKLVLPLQAPKP